MKADERIRIRLAVHAAIMKKEIATLGISRELASKRAYNEVLKMKWRELERYYEEFRFKEAVEKEARIEKAIEEDA